MSSQSRNATNRRSTSGGELTPEIYARRLLDSLACNQIQLPIRDDRLAGLLWAASGAMCLSGHAHELPRVCPAPLAACAQGAWLALASLVPQLDPHFSAYRLLGERAAISNLQRHGRRAAGGACTLYDTADGVIALNLARDDDRELLPAWLECAEVAEAELGELLTKYQTGYLLERGRVLGLALASAAAPVRCDQWFYAKRFAPAVAKRSEPPLVIDLSGLWAGPLCGQILGQCGARVIKVESRSRPDGARNGPKQFFDLMNGGKESVALDFRDTTDQKVLRALIAKADIVIEAARPRALLQLGIVAAELIAENPGMTWLSITGYGREAPMGDWIAYGDDAGVAAGLSWLMGGSHGDPVFCGDAIADPLTGLHAALLAYSSWQCGGGELLDISLHRTVNYVVTAGASFANGVNMPAAEMPDVIAPPWARAVTVAAAKLGADTEKVLNEFL